MLEQAITSFDSLKNMYCTSPYLGSIWESCQAMGIDPIASYVIRTNFISVGHDFVSLIVLSVIVSSETCMIMRFLGMSLIVLLEKHLYMSC